jgi:hypothetical protein
MTKNTDKTAPNVLSAAESVLLLAKNIKYTTVSNNDEGIIVNNPTNLIMTPLLLP